MRTNRLARRIAATLALGLSISLVGGQALAGAETSTKFQRKFVDYRTVQTP